MKQTFLPLLLIILLFQSCQSPSGKGNMAIAESTGLPSEPPASPGLNYSFVVMGCNRISWSDDEAGWKSSPWFNEGYTNLNQLNATFDDVMKLDPLPDFFFFVGDLVLAENKDTSVLAAQLKGWKKIYEAHPISKSTVKMVAIPGNHEFLYSEPPAYNELPSEYAPQVWLRLMKEFIAGNNGPGKGGPDKLLQDESRLTYSIDHKGDHFVLMNTDTYNEPGKVPLNWIMKDITTWRASHKKGHIFLLGHKPAYDAAGLATGDASDPGMAWKPEQVETLWKAMNSHACEAMLSAHEHLFWAGQPAGGNSWQIIAGNGGTTLDQGDFFGFTEVRVMKNGRVSALSHGRAVPSPDYGPVTVATTVRDTYDLTWPRGKK